MLCSFFSPHRLTLCGARSLTLCWDDLCRTSGDRLYFQEFIHVFAQWLGLLEDDDDLTVWSRSGSRSGVATAKGFDNGFGSIAVNPSFRNPRLSAVTLPGSFSDGSSRVSGTSEMHKDDSVCQISEMSYVE